MLICVGGTIRTVMRWQSNVIHSAIGNADDEIHLILSYETSQSFHKKFNNTTNKFSIRQIITHFKNFAFKTLTTFI